MLPEDAYVKVIIEGRTVLWPLMEYLDIRAIKYGHDCYEDLIENGYSIAIPEELYDKDGNPYAQEDVLNILPLR